MLRVASLVAAMAVVSVSVSANADSSSSTGQEGRICTVETVVGSHMPRRVCTTAAEREAMRNAANDQMTRMKTAGRTNGLPSKN